MIWIISVYIHIFKWKPLQLKRKLVHNNVKQNIFIEWIVLPPAIPIFVNTLKPRQNGRHFADDTFKHIFLNENVRISILISMKFVPKGPVNNIPALIQIMAWRQPGDKPLSEPMMVSLLMHICITRPQWVKRHSETNILQRDLQLQNSNAVRYCYSAVNFLQTPHKIQPIARLWG